MAIMHREYYAHPADSNSNRKLSSQYRRRVHPNYPLCWTLLVLQVSLGPPSSIGMPKDVQAYNPKHISNFKAYIMFNISSIVKL